MTVERIDRNPSTDPGARVVQRREPMGKKYKECCLNKSRPLGFEEVLVLLKGVTRTDETKATAFCPAHDDGQHPGLHVTRADDGTVLFTCWSGRCPAETIVAAIGLRFQGRYLVPDDHHHAVGALDDGGPHDQQDADDMPVDPPDVGDQPATVAVTIEALSDAKRLPVDFLRTLGLKNLSRGGVKIPYSYMNGSPAPRARLRFALRATEGSKWTKGPGEIVPYALEWFCDRARQAGYGLLVEGESDVWTARLHDVPALGIPGATMTKVLRHEYVAEVADLCVLQEPGGGGVSFVQDTAERLKAIGWTGTVRVLTMPDGLKDLNDLHRDDPDHERFRARLQERTLAAVPLAQWTPGRATTAVSGAEPLEDMDEAGEADSEADLPVINLTTIPRLSKRTTAAIAALMHRNGEAPWIFQQGGVLVRLRLDDDAPRVEPLTRDAVCGELDRAALWLKKKALVGPPASVVRDLLSLPKYSFPRLRAVVEAPFYTRDARLVATEGYHPDAGVYLTLPAGLLIPEVPAVPSADDVRWAKDLIRELFRDFPFIDAASRAHAVALLLLPIVRDMIPGPTPLHALDTPMPGTGKGLLADVIAIVATGRSAEVMTEVKDAEELRKRITAVLLAGGPLGLFDNVSKKIESGVLAALLTATVWRDRILGLSRMVRLPIRTTWIATGNELEFSRENLRRTVWIRMDAKVPEPHLRDKFCHYPLGDWVHAHRGELLLALFVLVQHWVAQGQPRFTARRLGSYEGWGEVVGGILASAGIDGFLENLAAFSARSDSETAGWNRLVSTWWTQWADKPADPDHLHTIATLVIPEVLGKGLEHSQKVLLGQALRKKLGWIFTLSGDGGSKTLLKIERAEIKDAGGRARPAWRLVKVTEPDKAPDTPGTPGEMTEKSMKSATPGVPGVPPLVPATPETPGVPEKKGIFDTSPGVPGVASGSAEEEKRIPMIVRAPLPPDESAPRPVKREPMKVEPGPAPKPQRTPMKIESAPTPRPRRTPMID